MLYDEARFEPLTEAPWAAAAVEDAIAEIVADVAAAFDPDRFWPAHSWDSDDGEAQLPLKGLYVGAGGVIWALDALRRQGHAETPLDLAAAALRLLELWRAEPDWYADFLDGETHAHPASLLWGETGLLLAAFRVAPHPALADELHALSGRTSPT